MFLHKPTICHKSFTIYVWHMKVYTMSYKHTNGTAWIWKTLLITVYLRAIGKIIATNTVRKTIFRTLFDPPCPGQMCSLFSHIVSVRPENKNTLQRYMGPGGSLNSQDWFPIMLLFVVNTLWKCNNTRWRETALEKFRENQVFQVSIDPRGRPTVTAGSGRYFRTSCLSVRTSGPTFQNLAKQNNFQAIDAAEIVGLAEWITYGNMFSCFALFSVHATFFLIWMQFESVQQWHQNKTAYLICIVIYRVGHKFFHI